MRYLAALVAGTLVTLGLFYLMSYLISQGKDQNKLDLSTGSVVEFIRVRQDENLQTRERVVPKKPEPPKEPPSQPKVNVASNEKPQAQDLNIQAPKIADGLKGGMGPYLGGGGGGASGDSEEMPIVRIEPQYPQQAAMQGIEGYVTVSFIITKTGSTRDVKVIDANPPRVFNQAAQRAVLRWRYKPRYVDGEPVERPGTVTLDFKLSD